MNVAHIRGPQVLRVKSFLKYKSPNANKNININININYKINISNTKWYAEFSIYNIPHLDAAYLLFSGTIGEAHEGQWLILILTATLDLRDC